jgi:hypothetical protein
MQSNEICGGCESRMAEASAAMRRHASDLEEAIRTRNTRGLTEDQRRDYINKLVTSFNAAQSAWGVYRDHLAHHGLLAPSVATPAPLSAKDIR